MSARAASEPGRAGRSRDSGRALSTGSPLGYQIGFISFTRLANVFRLAGYLAEAQPRYALRAALIGLSSLASAPLRVLERLLLGRHIQRVEVAPPLFIIGHWRSGTTHLHNLMSQDPRFGSLSMFQAVLPEGSLLGGKWAKRVLARVVPLKRPMDNMTWPMDAPQEEEIPLAKATPYSFYTQFLFPRRTREFFERFVLLGDDSGRVKEEIKREYHRLLQVATLHAGGRPLVLKNPVNTARIRLLLELYPKAKFVHISRSPYAVYASSRNLHRKIHVITTLQDVDDDSAEETVLYLYERLMARYLEDRARIPDGNLIEVRFEDLERDPFAELERVYAALGLPAFEQVEPRLRRYLDGIRGYRKNSFELSDAERLRVERRWAFAFEALGYPVDEAAGSR